MKYECTICQKPVQKLIEYLMMVVCTLNMHRKKDVTKQNMIVRRGRGLSHFLLYRVEIWNGIISFL